jgi:sugar transferase (PEP-CTERM/EpsH1 system associated)
MRVLFLAHRLPYPPNKGDKIRSHWELRQLAERFEVDLYCFYDSPDDARELRAASACCSQFYAEPINRPGARARALASLLQGKSFTLAYFHSRTMARQIRQALESQGYDLIFVFCSSMAPYVMQEGGVPRILDLADVDSDKWAQYAAHSSPPIAAVWRREAALLAAFEKQSVEAFDATLVCTAAESEVLRRIVESRKIEVVENFLDMGHFDPKKVEMPAAIRALQPYVVFTGSMDYFPNVDAVVYFHREILPLLRARIPRIKFVIAGRNPQRAVRRLGRDPAVHVTGEVADLKPYLKGAAAAVAPLRIARGVQNKIFEAMAMDLPIVASSKVASALPPELAALIRWEDDPVQFGCAVTELAAAREGGSTPGTRAAVLRHFGGRQQAEQLEAVLEKVLREGGKVAAQAALEPAGVSRNQPGDKHDSMGDARIVRGPARSCAGPDPKPAEESWHEPA